MRQYKIHTGSRYEVSAESKYVYKGIKIIFSLISVMLMFPLMMEMDGGSYYRTLFIFLIGKVVDLFFADESNHRLFFRVWAVFNQLIGAFACALAFSSMISDFSLMLESYLQEIKIGLMACVISCMMRDIVELFVMAIQVKIRDKRVSREYGHILRER